MGKFILFGMMYSLPICIAGIAYARWVGKKIYRVPDPVDNNLLIDRPYTKEELNSYSDIISDKDIPSTFLAFLPIGLPIFLILLNTLAKANWNGRGYIT